MAVREAGVWPDLSFMTTSTARTISVALLVLALALTCFPRFDRQDIGPIKKFTGKIDGEQSFGDAVYYMNYVEYFRGEAQLSDVDLPFRYRPLIPFLASLLPIESPMTALNVVNMIALYITLLILFLFLRHIGFDFGLAIVGCFMYAVSFPVFYMSTTGYLEACAMCMLAAGLYAIFRGNWIAAAVVIAAGVFVKETIALLIPVAIVYLWMTEQNLRRILPIAMLQIAAFVISTIAIKWIFRDAGDFYWMPSVSTLIDNLRFRALASLLLSFGIPGMISIVFAAKWRRMSRTVDRQLLVPILAGIVFTLLLVFYSMVTAYTDGRFIWPMTLFTIPLSLWVIRDRMIQTR